MKKEGLVFEQLNPDACKTYLVGSPETGEAALVGIRSWARQRSI